MHAFTPRQRSKLLANRNVLDVSEKFITFTPAFKISAVRKFFAGVPANQIFEDAEIPIEFLKEDYCRHCLKRWVKKFNEEGEESFNVESRGVGSPGRPKEERLEDLSYDELLALVEIQKGALEELKKQRALAKKKY